MFIELSYPIGPGITVMESGVKPPVVKERSRISKGNHSNTSYLEMFAHCGTHIDAPWHFIDSGMQIMDFSIEKFVFSKILILHVPAEPWEPIPIGVIQPYGGQLNKCDALLIHTGFAKFRQSAPEHYIEATPGLSVGAAQFLSGFTGLGCIGIDFASVENIKKGRETGFPVHHALLGRKEPIVLLEDVNLSEVAAKKVVRLFLFPLRMEGIEASPVTAVAEI